MKSKIRTKAMSWLLALVMLISIVPVTSLTVQAATIWNVNHSFSSGMTYNDPIIVTKNVTLTLNGCDVTANAGIYIQSGTLTITGTGKLYVYGNRAAADTMGHGIIGNVVVNGSRLEVNPADRGDGIQGDLQIIGDASVDVYGGYGGSPQSSGVGSAGGRGISGNVTVSGGSLYVEGGSGGDGAYGVGSKRGGDGGVGIGGNVTIRGGGYLHAIGGSGGMGIDYGSGGVGHYGIVGTLTVTSGSAMVIGGGGGEGYNTPAPNAACYRTITAGVRKESTTGGAWTDISGDTSTLQYVKVEGHGHKFTYSASGSTITAVCSTDECPLQDNTGTLTINHPKGSLVSNGLVRDAVLTGSLSEIVKPAITYTKDGVVVEASQVKDVGDYVATMTLGDAVASVEFTITPSDYIVTIPAKIDAQNSGYNATDGITASGTIDSETKLVITASSANNWNLRDSGIGFVPYYLTTDEGGEKTTRWTFDDYEMAETTTKPMGAVIVDCSKAPAGDYADTVTFTVSMEWK